MKKGGKSLSLEEENEVLKQENAELKLQLKEFQRLLFGAKSERFVSDTPEGQLALFDQSEAPQQPAVKEQIQYERRKPNKGKGSPIRAKLPPHLLRKEELIEPENLPEGAVKLGEEITELLEYTPGKLHVRLIRRPKYKVDSPAESSAFLVAPLPSLPIPKGNAGAGLLAHIQVSKWVDHLPYYRQAQIFKREGVEISKSTFNGWFKATCELLEALYEVLVAKVQSQNYLQADESPINVLESDHKKATHKGFHWVYHAPKAKMAVFDYRPGRGSQGPGEFLKDFQGALQTDAYKVYDKLGKNYQLDMLACMAHARRRFEKALDNDKDRASYAMQVFQQLYAIEQQARENNLDAEARKQHRLQQAKPILEAFKQWMDEQTPKVLPKSAIGDAIQYTLNIWAKLVRYLENGEWEIDNNLIENLIRPLALGRKNYLFAGSHDAAQRAAMMYSFFATCKLNQIEPYAWLRDVLERIPNHKINQLKELLPQNWKPVKNNG
jgi:transposase